MSNQEFVSKSLKTILEMLSDRKIVTTDVAAAYLGFAEFLDGNQNKVSFAINIKDSVKVLYYLPQKFKWSELKKVLEESEDDNVHDLLIIVLKESVSPNNMKLINTFIGNTYKDIQVFELKELQVNISKHVLQPKFEVVTDEAEIKSVIDRYSLKSKTQLLHILRTDAMSKYLGLKAGDVVKITRVSPTSGEYIVYRCCI